METPTPLSRIKIKHGHAQTYMVRDGDRVTVLIPSDDAFPDASRKASVEGEMREDTFVIHRLSTTSLNENQGYARGLLLAIQQGLPIKSITALRPTQESQLKGIYQKSGFVQEGGNMVWHKK